MVNRLVKRAERSEIELKLYDAVVPVKGLINYIDRTSREGYTAREALDIHFNGWVLTGVNLAYVAISAMVINAVVR